MGNPKKWRQLMQPKWYVNTVRSMITGLAGGYEEAVDWIGRKENPDDGGTTPASLVNRLRDEGDQIFPLGWAMLLQQVAGNHCMAHAIAKESGGVFIPLADIGEVDNSDIDRRLLEAIEQVSRYSQEVRLAIEDGVIDPSEREAISNALYLAVAKFYEHESLACRVYCEPEKSNARECAAPGVVACRSFVES